MRQPISTADKFPVKMIPFREDWIDTSNPYEPTEVRIRLKDQSDKSFDIDLSSIKVEFEHGKENYLDHDYPPPRFDDPNSWEVVTITFRPKEDLLDKSNFNQLVAKPLWVTIQALPMDMGDGRKPRPLRGRCAIQIETPVKIYWRSWPVVPGENRDLLKHEATEKAPLVIAPDGESAVALELWVREWKKPRFVENYKDYEFTHWLSPPPDSKLDLSIVSINPLPASEDAKSSGQITTIWQSKKLLSVDAIIKQYGVPSIDTFIRVRSYPKGVITRTSAPPYVSGSEKEVAIEHIPLQLKYPAPRIWSAPIHQKGYEPKVYVIDSKEKGGTACPAELRTLNPKSKAKNKDDRYDTKLDESLLVTVKGNSDGLVVDQIEPNEPGRFFLKAKRVIIGGKDKEGGSVELQRDDKYPPPAENQPVVVPFRVKAYPATLQIEIWPDKDEKKKWVSEPKTVSSEIVHLVCPKLPADFNGDIHWKISKGPSRMREDGSGFKLKDLKDPDQTASITTITARKGGRAHRGATIRLVDKPVPGEETIELDIPAPPPPRIWSPPLHQEDYEPKAYVIDSNEKVGTACPAELRRFNANSKADNKEDRYDIRANEKLIVRVKENSDQILSDQIEPIESERFYLKTRRVIIGGKDKDVGSVELQRDGKHPPPADNQPVAVPVRVKAYPATLQIEIWPDKDEKNKWVSEPKTVSSEIVHLVCPKLPADFNGDIHWKISKGPSRMREDGSGFKLKDLNDPDQTAPLTTISSKNGGKEYRGAIISLVDNPLPAYEHVELDIPAPIVPKFTVLIGKYGWTEAIIEIDKKDQRYASLYSGLSKGGATLRLKVEADYKSPKGYVDLSHYREREVLYPTVQFFRDGAPLNELKYVAQNGASIPLRAAGESLGEMKYNDQKRVEIVLGTGKECVIDLLDESGLPCKIKPMSETVEFIEKIEGEIETLLNTRTRLETAAQDPVDMSKARNRILDIFKKYHQSFFRVYLEKDVKHLEDTEKARRISAQALFMLYLNCRMQKELFAKLRVLRKNAALNFLQSLFGLLLDWLPFLWNLAKKVKLTKAVSAGLRTAIKELSEKITKLAGEIGVLTRQISVIGEVIKSQEKKIADLVKKIEGIGEAAAKKIAGLKAEARQLEKSIKESEKVVEEWVSKKTVYETLEQSRDGFSNEAIRLRSANTEKLTRKARVVQGYELVRLEMEQASAELDAILQRLANAADKKEGALVQTELNRARARLQAAQAKLNQLVPDYEKAIKEAAPIEDKLSNLERQASVKNQEIARLDPELKKLEQKGHLEAKKIEGWKEKLNKTNAAVEEELQTVKRETEEVGKRKAIEEDLKKAKGTELETAQSELANRRRDLPELQRQKADKETELKRAPSEQALQQAEQELRHRLSNDPSIGARVYKFIGWIADWVSWPFEKLVDMIQEGLGALVRKILSTLAITLHYPEKIVREFMNELGEEVLKADFKVLSDNCVTIKPTFLAGHGVFSRGEVKVEREALRDSFLRQDQELERRTEGYFIYYLTESLSRAGDLAAEYKVSQNPQLCVERCNEFTLRLIETIGRETTSQEYSQGIQPPFAWRAILGKNETWLDLISCIDWMSSIAEWLVRLVSLGLAVAAGGTALTGVGLGVAAGLGTAAAGGMVAAQGISMLKTLFVSYWLLFYDLIRKDKYLVLVTMAPVAIYNGLFLNVDHPRMKWITTIEQGQDWNRVFSETRLESE